MNQHDPSNQSFDLSWKFINQTSCNVFLTGKAGTGKTTFLKLLRANSHKKLAVVAPTGVAAINAGGTTIHSFFQLPHGNYIPEGGNLPEGNFYNRFTLLKQLRLNSNKRRLMQEIELMVIDEVSMVRADLIDAMDTILRTVRKQPALPFGGVQMLFIGDLFQLPPVIEDYSWNILRKYYNGSFFFHAKAFEGNPPLYLELKKIYRQSDSTFITLLNNLRNNTVKKEDIAFLNSFYKPAFKPQHAGEYIILTTHNSKAEQINRSALEQLKGKFYTFEASINNDFNEKSSPAEFQLRLKVGAQVMFIKNDKGESRRYYNGKIGIVKKLSEGEIIVEFPGENDELKVEKETWKNIRYQFNSETDHVDEEVLGTFTQYPIRLAWAITIHKSQGLTFDKAIIDAGESFAPGQVYVAPSRLTSLNGLVLYSTIDPPAISTDKEAISFSQTELENDKVVAKLEVEQKQYIHSILLKIFTWTTLISAIEKTSESLEGKKLPHLDDAKELFKQLLKKADEQEKTAEKFRHQLEKLFSQVDQTGYNQVHGRVESASKFFTDALHNELFIPLKNHYEETRTIKRVKNYLNDLKVIHETLKNKKEHLQNAINFTNALVNGKEIDTLLKEIIKPKPANTSKEEDLKSTKPKLQKGETFKMTLDLFKAGKSISDISKERGLAPGTVESHIVTLIVSGEIELNEFVAEEKIKTIKSVSDETGEAPLGLLKEKLGEEFSYGEIKAVVRYYQVQKEKAVDQEI